MYVRRIDDGTNLSRHHLVLVNLGDIALRVVLQVKLAALPGHTRKHRLACGFEAGMVVAGDELDTAQAAFNTAV